MMQRLKQNLLKKETWLPILPMFIFGFANPLHLYIGIPIWLTYLAATLILIGLSVVYWFKGADDRRKIAEDKKAFAAKVAAAEIQLFGTKQH